MRARAAIGTITPCVLATPMGQEFAGTVIVGGQKVAIQADFGSDRVRLSGGKRGDVPYKQVEILSTAGGLLKLRIDGTLMEFQVGPNVDRLAKKIRKPATRIEKLGIKAELSVAVVGPLDKAFLTELRQAVPKFKDGLPTKAVDVLLWSVKSASDLEDAARLAGHITPTGGLWMIYRKGKRDPSEDDVLAAGRGAGLKDIKVARFSETHTALKFVVPLADRDPAEPQRGVRGIIKPKEPAPGDTEDAMGNDVEDADTDD